jgi:hypothetical protein
VRTLTVIRFWIVIEMIGLVISGLTAFPLELELRIASAILNADWSPAGAWMPGVVEWVDLVHLGLVDSYGAYPFIAYGTDWLAFAHLVIAAAFIGPLRDPVRNVWTVQWGLIACLGIIPLALIAGSIRGLPLGWMLIDISFGVVGAIPLLFALAAIRKLERERQAPTPALAASPSQPSVE